MDLTTNCPLARILAFLAPSSASDTDTLHQSESECSVLQFSQMIKQQKRINDLTSAKKIKKVV